MNIPVRTFTDLVRDMSAAILASASGLIDMSVGSILRAIIEANAAVVQWAQWLVLLALQTTRAATSSGSDLDTWMADFSLTRLPAEVASGVATFSRYATTMPASVPSGTVVKTIDGSVAFSVVTDQGNPAWNPTTAAYAMAIGITSLDLPIVATVPGSSGNLSSGTIGLLASPVPGIDTVTNNAPTSGGTDAETYDAFRSRFSIYFNSRSRATADAIGYAISQVNPDLSYLLQENVGADGTTRVGNISITVNDGTGTLSSNLLNALSTSLNTVRPIGTSFSIVPPEVLSVQIAMIVTYPPEVASQTVQSAIASAVEDYISQIPIGGSISVTRLGQVSYNAAPEILNISDITLNGQTSDLIAPATTIFSYSGITFS